MDHIQFIKLKNFSDRLFSEMSGKSRRAWRQSAISDGLKVLLISPSSTASAGLIW